MSDNLKTAPAFVSSNRPLFNNCVCGIPLCLVTKEPTRCAVCFPAVLEHSVQFTTTQKKCFRHAVSYATVMTAGSGKRWQTAQFLPRRHQSPTPSCRRVDAGSVIALWTAFVMVLLAELCSGSDGYTPIKYRRRSIISSTGWSSYEMDLTKMQSCVSPLDSKERMSNAYVTLDPEDSGYWAWERDAFKRALQNVIFPDALSYKKYLLGDNGAGSSSSDNGSSSVRRLPPLSTSLPDRCEEPPRVRKPVKDPVVRETNERAKFMDHLINLAFGQGKNKRNPSVLI